MYSKHWTTEQWQLLSAYKKAAAEPRKFSGFQGALCTSTSFHCQSGSRFLWRKGGIADILYILTEAKSLRTIYEDIMVDPGFDIVKEMTMNNTVFWVVTPCISKEFEVVLLLGLLFHNEDGSNISLQNIGLTQNYMKLQPRSHYHENRKSDRV